MTDVHHENTLPWRRDAEALRKGLEGWARSFAGNRAVVADVRVPDSGMANDTVMFRLDGVALVARLAPAPDSPYPTFPSYDLDAQDRVIRLVSERTTVPVPKVVHLERSDEWLGVPFLVSEAIEGLVPSDNPPYLMDPNGWFLQGTVDQWRRLEIATIDVLVKLHRIEDDEDTAFLRPDAPGETALARQLAHLRRYYEWARDGVAVPVLDRAFEVLPASIPTNDRSVLNWGDSRPGNIIYRDFEPVAVLDWEMATVGPPEVDLAWVTFFQRFFSHLAGQYGLGPVPAMFGRADTVSTYERLSGDALDDLAWYEALAGLRFGIILTRMSLRSIAHGRQERPADADELVMFAPLLERLLDDA